MKMLRIVLVASLTAFVSGILLPCAPESLAGTFVTFGPQDYTRGTGKPVEVTHSFNVRNPNTDYLLHLINGGANGH